MSIRGFQIGDRVIVRPEARSKFVDGTPAARGDTLTVHQLPNSVILTAISHGRVQIGPGPRDYAYEHELIHVGGES